MHRAFCDRDFNQTNRASSYATITQPIIARWPNELESPMCTASERLLLLRTARAGRSKSSVRRHFWSDLDRNGGRSIPVDEHSTAGKKMGQKFGPLGA